MHIPDGLLDLKTTVATTAVTSFFLYKAFGRIKNTLEEKVVPVVASLGAFVFVLQMINFPVSAGTSGHVTGAFLLTYLLGPWMSMIVLSLVLFVQSIIFQDGGITALPANILNMAILGSLVSAMILNIFKLKNSREPEPFSNKIVIIGGCVFAVVAMAVAGALEFWASGLFELKTILILLGGSHVLIGIGEAIITLFILSFLKKLKPEILNAFH